MLANDIAFPPEGGYLLTGWVEDRGGDICYLKLNQKGMMEWNKIYTAESGRDRGFYTKPADNGGYISFCRVIREPEAGYWGGGDAPPPRMPRGLILKLDSLCNKQSEIQFYYFPESTPTFFNVMPTGDYLVVSGKTFIKIAPNGEEVWHKEYNLGIYDGVDENIERIDGKLFLIGLNRKTNNVHSYGLSIVNLDLSGKISFLSEWNTPIPSNRAKLVHISSRVIHAYSFSKNSTVDIEPHIVLSSHGIEGLKMSKGFEDNIKIRKRDSLFYGGQNLLPVRTLDIAEKPAQINAQKIKLSIKKHSKQEP